MDAHSRTENIMEPGARPAVERNVVPTPARAPIRFMSR